MAFHDDFVSNGSLPPTGDVILDFTGVSYVTSASLSTLLALRTQFKSHNRRLRLCSISPRVWGLFAVTGLNQVFDVDTNADEAIESLKSP